MKRLLLLLAFAAATAAAQHGPPASEILRIAPQLLSFAGSSANFERLASGLHGGTQVALVSITPDGMRETVAFTAASALSAGEIAATLAAAREVLLARGITQPSGWEIALALMGGSVITPEGPARMPGLLAPADPARPLVISLRPFAGSPGNYRSLMAGLTRARPITLVDAADRRARVSFTVPCGPISEPEARQALAATSDRLSAQGIGDPTGEELKRALLAILDQRNAN